MGVPPRGIQPKNRLPKEENEEILKEALRRMHLRLPGWLANALAIVIGGGGGGGSLPQQMVTDEGIGMVDDNGNPIYVG